MVPKLIRARRFNRPEPRQVKLWHVYETDFIDIFGMFCNCDKRLKLSLTLLVARGVLLPKYSSVVRRSRVHFPPESYIGFLRDILIPSCLALLPGRLPDH